MTAIFTFVIVAGNYATVIHLLVHPNFDCGVLNAFFGSDCMETLTLAPNEQVLRTPLVCLCLQIFVITIDHDCGRRRLLALCVWG